MKPFTQNVYHYSVSYKWRQGLWQPIHAWIGYNSEDNLTKFTRWVRSDTAPSVPPQFDCLSDVGGINIEFKDDKVIEVHLRTSGNPDGSTHDEYNEYIPVWRSDDPSSVTNYLERGYIFIDTNCDMSDVEPYTSEHRIGFLVR